MANEWPLVTVGKLAESISDTHKLDKDRLIFLNTSDVFLGHVLHHTYSEVGDWPGQAKKSIRRNDILFSEIRPANGRWAYIDFDADDYVVSTKLMVIRSRKDRVNSRFLYHFLTSGQTTHWLQYLAESRSGTFPQITFDQIAELELKLPPLSTQVEVAVFLDCINDQIELNRRMNETLESMARALFKSWFVDFDPVRAKVESRDTSLSKEIADLFSDRFEESELGSIPKGWMVGRLDDVLVLQRGFDLPASSRSPGPYPVIAASGPSGTHDHFMVRGPGVTTGRSGVLGAVFFVHEDFWPLNTSLWVNHFKGSVPSYAYHLLRRLDFGSFNAGSAVPTLNRNHVHNLPTIVPSPRLVEVFDSIVTPLMKRQRSGELQALTLAAIRDTLLPKLISGELSLKDAERQVEAAL
jgi:type I restriction enzyme S subunit